MNDYAAECVARVTVRLAWFRIPNFATSGKLERRDASMLGPRQQQIIAALADGPCSLAALEHQAGVERGQLRDALARFASITGLLRPR